MFLFVGYMSKYSFRPIKMGSFAAVFTGVVLTKSTTKGSIPTAGGREDANRKSTLTIGLQLQLIQK